MLHKVPNWEDKLQDYTESKMRVPFKWGSNDCITFAASWLDILYNTRLIDDIEKDWKYFDKDTANNLIQARSGDLLGVASVFLSERGFISKSVLKSRRGDIVIVNTDNGYMMTINTGKYLIAPGETGIVFLSLLDGEISWGNK